jgi:hypothetical protein
MKKSILDKQVSLFASYTKPEAANTHSLLEWLTTDEYKKEVTKIRKCNNETARKQLKQGLPAVTPSGVFEGCRRADKLVEHSGLICLDIDRKDNPDLPDWDAVKGHLSNYSSLAYCGLSVSGNGLFVVVPIKHFDQHLQHFFALQQFFQVGLGITVDKACKDVSRLRGISYDPHPYINHSAEVFDAIVLPKNDSKSVNFIANSSSEAINLRHVVRAVERQKIDITPSYQEWRNVGFALANSFGEEGRLYYHRLSRFHPNYCEASCNRQYNSCLKDRDAPRDYRIGFGTLVHIARQYIDI